MILAIGIQVEKGSGMQIKATLLFVLFVFGNSYSATTYSVTDGPWDIERLFQVPQWEKTETAAKPGMTGLLYDAIPVRGKRVRWIGVF